MEAQKKTKSVLKKDKSEKATSGKRTNIGATINEGLWRRLKAQAALRGISAGKLIDQIIEEFLKKNELRPKA
jgi:predicted DNA-binding ribbon-helix-helix protein